MHDIIYPLITVRPLCYNTSVAPSQPPFRRHPARQRRQKIRHDHPKPSSRHAQQRDKTGLPTLLQMGKKRSGQHTDALGIPAPSGPLRYVRVRALVPRTLARSPFARSPSHAPLRALPSVRFPACAPLRARTPLRALHFVRSLSASSRSSPALKLPCIITHLFNGTDHIY